MPMMCTPVQMDDPFHEYIPGDCEVQGCIEVCPECRHSWDDHSFIPSPRKSGTLYVGCHATSFGINADDDLLCGCQISRPVEVCDLMDKYFNR